MTLFDYENEKPERTEHFNHKQGVLVKILKKHCVGEDNKRTASELLPLCNAVLEERYGMWFKDDFELRLCLKSLKDDKEFLRIIGSTSSGVWLACKSDIKNANGYMISRTNSSLETSIKNGVDINVFYKKLKELKELYFPVDNQERIVLHTEKRTVKRFSDDLRGIEE